MAYSLLPTKNTGDPITLTNWNAIRDNFIAGVPDLYTAKGDLAPATGADAAARLAVGANDSILVADSGEATGLAWQIQPAVRVYNSLNITPAATGVWEALTFDSERFDTDGMHSTVTNPSRLTVPSGGAGIYLIGGNVQFDTSSLAPGTSGHYGARILLDGTTILARTMDEAEMQSRDYQITISTLYSLAVANYVELNIYTTQNVDIVADGNSSPVFWAIWERRA